MTILAHDTLARPQSDKKGLCVTCRYRDSCMHAGAHAVWHCELFDDGRDNSRPIGLVSAPRVELAADPHAGLCANCDERETCTLRPARGGVWHCDEYR